MREAINISCILYDIMLHLPMHKGNKEALQVSDLRVIFLKIR